MSSDRRYPNPDELLIDLNDAQRAAVQRVRGPVVVEAGAGSGKTRVISRRAAYAAATGAIDPNRMLLITFTEKAGAEMSQRIRHLGLRGAMANNVHSFALRQLIWLWPRFNDSLVPTLLPDPYRLVNAFLRSRASKVNAPDVVSEIRWAKARGIRPAGYLAALAGRQPAVPTDLAAEAFADYERRKQAARLMDFDDILTLLATLINENDDVADLVRSRRTWICVDEYQDTNFIQDALFTAWLGDSTDFCVVGDIDQAIFGFTGATSDYLTGFPKRFQQARRFELTDNYRSSPEVLEVANKLLAAEHRRKRLQATRPSGPTPRVTQLADGESEVRAVIDEIRRLAGIGVEFSDMAMLFRQRAHRLPFEEALRTARIPFRSVDPFFARREVVMAIEALSSPATGSGLSEIAARTWSELFGFDVRDADNAGDSRWDSINALLHLAAELEKRNGPVTPPEFAAELQTRGEAEAGSKEGVELTTYHQAKGREWPVVLLPMLEEGTLPDFRARSPDERAEEWRLLHVGITRAERFLWISHADERTRGEKTFRPLRSSFLYPLSPAPPTASKPTTRASRRTAGWPPANTREITAATLLPRGARVVHRTLGRGVVWSMDGSTISVRFDVGMRKLTWPEVGTRGKLRRATGG